MWAPVKFSMQLRAPGTPRWAAEWAAPDGKRIVGFGDTVAGALADLGTRAMWNAQGEKTMDEEAAEYLHGEGVAVGGR
jgi:hypothetical protein